MNRQELVAAVAELSGQTKKASAEFVTAFVSVVSKAVSEGESVKVSGFGSWERVERAEKQGINPKTLQPLTIPAKKAVKFKAGKELKELANA